MLGDFAYGGPGAGREEFERRVDRAYQECLQSFEYQEPKFEVTAMVYAVMKAETEHIFDYRTFRTSWTARRESEPMRHVFLAALEYIQKQKDRSP